MKHFEKVAMIGIGLIGSSLARVIRKKGLADKISCVARQEKTRQTALDLGIVDEAFEEISLAVKDADIVFICTPVGSVAPLIEQTLPFLKKGAIITDVGSIKEEIINKTVHLDLSEVHFIPAHPVAGTEKSGPENGFIELFEERWCILTPLESADKDAVKAVRFIWEQAGMKVEEMSAKRHDQVMALMSHLPHLIAYTIVATAKDLETETRQDVIKYAAGGFRDFTRIAGSDAVMWRDIFLNNKEAVLECLQRFSEDLTLLQKAIRQKDGEMLQSWFQEVREIRRDVIDAHQEQPENEKRLLKQAQQHTLEKE